MQNTAYALRISDWSSDVCSSDLCLCKARNRGRCVAGIQDARFPQAFLPLQFGLRVVDYAAAYAKNTAFAVAHFYGAYGHIQRAIAIGGQPAPAAAVQIGRAHV